MSPVANKRCKDLPGSRVLPVKHIHVCVCEGDTVSQEKHLV